MAAQLALEGFEESPTARESLFLALFPDAETAARIAELGRQWQVKEGLRGKLLATARLHVTLHYLGDYTEPPASVLTLAQQAAATLALPPFELDFAEVGSFPGKARSKPFVLHAGTGNAALLAFRQQLGQALARAGLGRWVKPAWTPHLTLLYDSRTVATQRIEPLRWTAREFVLVRSLAGKAGAENTYIHVASWPLRTPVP